MPASTKPRAASGGEGAGARGETIFATRLSRGQLVPPGGGSPCPGDGHALPSPEAVRPHPEPLSPEPLRAGPAAPWRRPGCRPADYAALVLPGGGRCPAPVPPTRHTPTRSDAE